MTTNALQHYFETKGGSITTSGNLVVRTLHEGIMSSYFMGRYEEVKLNFDISITDNSPEEFINSFQIAGIGQLESLNYNELWIRYLNGQVEINIWTDEMEFTDALSFKISGPKTIVFSTAIHFYDEAWKHLTLPKDFAEYFRSRENLLNHFLNFHRYYER